jgi:hypothetical protein
MLRRAISEPEMSQRSLETSRKRRKRLEEDLMYMDLGLSQRSN